MNNIQTYDLVVIGGGSAGMAAAIEAKSNSVNNLLIIEKEDNLGGILLQCIHNGFGLHTFKEELTGPEYADRFATQIYDLNIPFKLNTTVLEINKYNDIYSVIYSNKEDGIVKVLTKTIIAATGCGERSRGAISLPGDRVSGVMTAGLAQRYLNIDGYLVGKKVFILGSGDIGLIMARRMKLEGAEVLGVAELMPYSNGLNRNIVQCLQDFEIPLYLHHTVKVVKGHGRLEKVIIQSVDEKFNFIEGTEKEFECDTLLLSVGLVPNNPLLEKLGVLLHPRTKGPVVDESYQTSLPGVFACGNSLHVHDLVDFVSSEGIAAGKSCVKYLNNKLHKNTKIEIKNSSFVSYVLPTMVDLNNVETIKINFRVAKPLNNVYLYIYQGEKVIKKIKKQYLIPAEMEQVLINKDLILSNEPIVLEVCDE